MKIDVNEKTIEDKIQDLQIKQRILEAYDSTRKHIIETMRWNYMDYHEADEDHDEAWYTAPDENDYRYLMYIGMNEMLAKCDKAIIGG